MCTDRFDAKSKKDLFNMISKLKKVSYLIISVILVMSLVSLFNYRQGEISPIQTFDQTHLRDFSPSTLDEEDDTADIADTRDHLFFTLPLEARPINLMQIELNAPMQEDNIIRVHYNTVEHGQVVEKHCTVPEFGAVDGNRLFIIFSQPVEDISSIKIESAGELSIKAISTYDTSAAPVSLKFNLIAFGILLVTIGVLVIIENKFGFFKWIVYAVRNEVCHIDRSAGRLANILHISACSITGVFIIYSLVFVMLNRYYKAWIMTAFVLAALSIILQICDKAVSERDIGPAKMFLAVASVAGILICITMPISTNLAWDDEIHLRQAYTFLHGTKSQISVAEWRLFNLDRYTYTNFTANPTQLLGILNAESSLTMNYELTPVNIYTTLGYMPMILSMAFSWLLQADIAKMLVFCRLANLLTYTLIIYLGIRKLKSGGYIASSIFLLPGTLFLACSCSYDPWLTAWFAYGIICIISVYQHPERKFEAWDLVKLLAVFFIACGPKLVYCIMFIPLLFLRTDKFQSKRLARNFRIATVATVIAIALILVIPAVFLYDFHTDIRGGEFVSGRDQVMYILSHPFRYCFVLLRHMGWYTSLKNFVDYAASFGFITGYAANPVAFWGSFSAIIVLYCILTDKSDDDLYDTRPMQSLRWLSLLTAFLQIIVVSTTMYIGFTDVGADYINGCQFRYLFPLLFSICFFIAPRGLRVRMNARLKSSIVFGSLMLNVMGQYLIAHIL